MSLEQGNLYKNKKKQYIKQEGFTNAFPNAVSKKNEEDEEKLNGYMDPDDFLDLCHLKNTNKLN